MLLGEPKTMDTIRERENRYKKLSYGLQDIIGFTEKNYRWIFFQLQSLFMSQFNLECKA
jgi:hypothetical protein